MVVMVYEKNPEISLCDSVCAFLLPHFCETEYTEYPDFKIIAHINQQPFLSKDFGAPCIILPRVFPTPTSDSKKNCAFLKSSNPSFNFKIYPFSHNHLSLKSP